MKFYFCKKKYDGKDLNEAVLLLNFGTLDEKCNYDVLVLVWCCCFAPLT